MFHDGFPDDLRNDGAKVVGLIPMKTYNNVSVGITDENIQYTQKNVVIKFPYRMYFIDVPDDVLNKLSLQQQMILHCIYSRCCDGFVRQKHIQSLLLMDYADWAMPYIVKICDEYVMEILEMTYDILRERDTEQIKRFCLENVQSFCRSYSRMTSYWNEYYRDRCHNFHEYIGRKLFRECFGYSKSLERINRI